MGLFDLFEDIQENIERKNEARELISKAKRISKTANEKYNRVYDSVKSRANEVQYELDAHKHYKEDLSYEIKCNINDTLSSFNNFNIDSKVVSMPSFDDDSFSFEGLDSFSYSLSNIIPNNPFDISIFDIFNNDDEYYEALSKYDEAVSYRNKIDYEIEKLYSAEEKLNEISSFISKERRQLSSLISKLKSMSNTLEEAMKKNSFTENEAKYLKGISKISQYLAKLFSTEFLNDNLNISQRYKDISNQISSINDHIPSYPCINDTAFIDDLIKVLDNLITY